MNGVHVPVPGLADPRASFGYYINVHTPRGPEWRYAILTQDFAFVNKTNLGKKNYIFLAQRSGTSVLITPYSDMT
jgi:hypothetical protein